MCTLHDSKMALRTTRSKVFHMLIVPSSPDFCSTASSFLVIQAILKKQRHWMTRKWHLEPRGQRYSIYILIVPSSPDFLLYRQPFSSYRPFWKKKDIEWLQNNIEHYEVKYTLLLPQSSKFHPGSFITQHVVCNLSATFHFPIAHNVKLIFWNKAVTWKKRVWLK